METLQEIHDEYMKKPYFVRRLRSIKSKIRVIRSEIRSSLTIYKFEGYKYPWLRLLSRPLRTIKGNVAWKRLTEEQRKHIHEEFVQEAYERGYDGIMAHGSAWAGEKHLRDENLVNSTVKNMGI